MLESNVCLFVSFKGGTDQRRTPAMFRAVFGNKKEGGGKKGDKKSQKNAGKSKTTDTLKVEEKLGMCTNALQFPSLSSVGFSC